MRSETRHQLKSDPFAEKFAEKAGSTINWAAANRSKLIIGGGAFVVVLLLVIGGWVYQRKQEQKASLALAEAMSTYQAPVVPGGLPDQPTIKTFSSDQERAKAANSQFRAVADKYSNDAGLLARYMAGVTAAELGSTADAEKELKTVSDKGDKDLASLAKLALAAVYRKTNRADLALSTYKDLADHPTRTVSKAMAQLETASTYEAQNQGDRAKEIYQQILKDNPKPEDRANASVELANERLAALGK